MFVNTLPLRSCPKSNLSFSSFLASLKSGVVSCLDNADYPYEELIEDLNVERDTSRNPLFDVMLAYQNFEETEFEIPGLKVKPFSANHNVSKFDITLFAFEKQEKILLTLEYSTRLFKKETIERLVGYFY